MISKRSFFYFLFFNLFFYFYGYIEYKYTNFFLHSYFLPFSLFFLSLFRNYFLYFLSSISTYNHTYIHNHYFIPSLYDYTSYISQISFLDTFSLYTLLSFTPMITHQNINIIHDMLLFIPKSFLFEIVFDFFHYWAHRIEHETPFLYQHFHKIHHKHFHPTLVTTFHHHYGDLLLSNVIPLFLSLFFITRFFSISHYMLHMLIISKIYLELNGHCGKDIKTGSFVQCIWLPQFFDISLYTADHDIHHNRIHYNFGKRFSLWDKLFDTYTSEKI